MNSLDDMPVLEEWGENEKGEKEEKRDLSHEATYLLSLSRSLMRTDTPFSRAGHIFGAKGVKQQVSVMNTGTTAELLPRLASLASAWQTRECVSMTI